MIKILGHIVTYFICSITIDKIEISESFILSHFIISPIINELLWVLSYYTCKKIVYQKAEINEPAVGSFGYTIAYIVYAVIIFAFLIGLKNLGIIPFASDFDSKFINCITEYFNNRIIEFSNKIVEVLITTNQ